MELLKKYSIHIRGITPLIMHSDKLCNPLHPLTKQLKEISSIRGKKDEHHIAMAHIEFVGGMYYDREIGVYMPVKCLMGCIQSAARKYKLGKATKAITIDAVIGVPLISYEGKTPEQLWSAKNKNDEQIFVFCESVVVSRARIMRTRPIFRHWEVKFNLLLNVELLSEQQLKTILDTAGMEFGLCELRPQLATGTYGKFEVLSIEEVKM